MTAAEVRESPVPDPLTRLDHLVYATPDVEGSVDHLASRLGVRAIAGGQHPQWGTRNALIALGEHTYLEIVGPDPGAPAAAGPRPFGLDGLQGPRLATWAVRGAALEQAVAGARAHGVDLGEVRSVSRRRPDGTRLRWTMTDALAPRAGGLIPFFIDWGDAPHPAAGAPRGGRVVRLHARHPEAVRVGGMLRDLGLALEVEPGERPELIAGLETPLGAVELR